MKNTYRYIKFMFLFITLAFLYTFPCIYIQAGTWIKKADMPTARAGVGVCAFEGKIYVVGGYGQDGKVLPNVEQYDPVSNTWKKLTDMKVPRAYPSLVALNGKLYAIGGENPSGCGHNVSSIERYDPSTDSWKVLMPMPTLGITHVGAVAGKITALGGLTAFQCKALPTRAVEQYDPTIDRWEDRAKCPTEKYFGGACVLDDKIYIVGGMLGENGLGAKIVNTVDVYDPMLDKWSKVSNLSRARAILSVCALNGKIYAIGGVEGDSRRSMKSSAYVEIYDPVSDKWLKGTEMPTPRAGLGICSINDKIYVIGGGDIANGEPPMKWANVFSLVEEYNPEGDQSVSREGKLTTTWGKLRKIE